MRAVLGYCASTAMATRLADAVAVTGPPPMVETYPDDLEGARTIVLDIGHADLLRAPEVHELVTDLLTGEHPW